MTLCSVFERIWRLHDECGPRQVEGERIAQHGIDCERWAAMETIARIGIHQEA
ncbi:MAG: hypothetical protein QM769_07220 [Pseudoxanthomonas sp.]